MSELSEALEQPINKPAHWPSETVEDYDERVLAWLHGRDVERAAARNWHTLTNPTDELIEASALWVSRIHSHNHAASVACIVCTETARAALRAAVDALTDTAEPGEV